MPTATKRKRKAKRKRKPPAKGGRPLMLTKALTRKICLLVRAGSFDHVAARANGISTTTFYRWMQEGRDAKRGTLKREFWEQVDRARAEARAAVEITVRQQNPTFWLRNGPGKTKRGEPGWTDPMGEIPVDGETGEPVEMVDPDILLTKLDGIRDRVLAEQAKEAAAKPAAKPRPKPKPKPK